MCFLEVQDHSPNHHFIHQQKGDKIKTDTSWMKYMVNQGPNVFITITIYRWAGRWGPFKIKIPCGECNLTETIVRDVIDKDLNTIPLRLVTKDWLPNWCIALRYGGWHAPIVMVNHKVVSQGKAVNRGLLIETVMQAYAKIYPLQGSHLFGKADCPYCQKAKELLQQHKIDFTYHDVIDDCKALYEMIGRVKPLIPATQPLTVPQIWLDGKYIGGCEDLETNLPSHHG